eukprot:230664-Amphidinium_carterae.1
MHPTATHSGPVSGHNCDMPDFSSRFLLKSQRHANQLPSQSHTLPPSESFTAKAKAKRSDAKKSGNRVTKGGSHWQEQSGS